MTTIPECKISEPAGKHAHHVLNVQFAGEGVGISSKRILDEVSTGAGVLGRVMRIGSGRLGEKPEQE